MRCAVCGLEETLPFKCSYCGEYYCSRHRLPERHTCPGLDRAKSPVEIEVKEKRREELFKSRKSTSEKFFSVLRENVRVLSERAFLGSSELGHLAAGTGLVGIAGLSLLGFWQPPELLIPSLILFAASFLVHEFAHKVVARRNHLLAEFRVDRMGALLTLITAIPLIPFKIVAPGAVFISGLASLKTIGRIAMAGPLTNIILSLIMMLVLTLPSPIPRQVVSYGYSINSFLAFFNLIPFGVLDGAKVYANNPRTWAVLFTVSFLLLLLLFLRLV